MQNGPEQDGQEQCSSRLYRVRWERCCVDEAAQVSFAIFYFQVEADRYLLAELVGLPLELEPN